MTKMEKVIKGLECYLTMRRGEKILCGMEHCPYWEEDDDTGMSLCNNYQIESDALALLKAQEPRVMTLREYKALAEKPKEERDPVWEEWPGLGSTWAIPNQAYGGYGTSWRCWTSRPTDEQREKVKWG